MTDDTAATLSAMAAGMGMSPADLATHPHALVGSVNQICDTLIERRETYGISYVTMSQRSLHAFAPVVARLSGS